MTRRIACFAVLLSSDDEKGHCIQLGVGLPTEVDINKTGRENQNQSIYLNT
jgi:hypothetical protein